MKPSRATLKIGTFLTIARAVSALGTCDRARVGCVLVLHGKIVGIGYNGSPSGSLHCDEVGHLLVDGSCKRTIHAEQNALINSTVEDLRGCIAYCTHSPCIACFNMLKQAGIVKIYFTTTYTGNLSSLNYLSELDITLEQFEEFSVIHV